MDQGHGSPQLQSQSNPALRYMALSVLFFTGMQIGVKTLKHIPFFELVFFRALITLVICVVQIRLQGLPFLGNNRRVLFLRGLVGTIALTLFFYTIQNMPLGSAVTIQYLSPMFTILIAGWLLREKAKPIQWLFFVIAFMGVLLVKGFDPRVTFLDAGLGVLAALGSGFAYNFIRMLRDTDHPLTVVFYFPLVTLPLISPFAFFYWVTPSLQDWPYVIAIGVCTQIAQIYMTKAYHADRAANVSIVKYGGVVMALLMGWLIFDEWLSPMSLLGIAVIMGAMILSALFRQRRRLLG